VQQVQVELRQLQQTLIIKQDELTRLIRGNERLLSEARQQNKVMSEQEHAMPRLTGEITSMKAAVAKADGAKEMLKEQLDESRDEAKRLEEEVALVTEEVAQAKRQLTEFSVELTQLRQKMVQHGSA
jgi:chromosome segregation ATPase